MANTVELYADKGTPEDTENQRRRQAAFLLMAPLTPVVPGDKLPTVGILGSGTYKGATLSGVIDLTGSNGTRVSGRVNILGSAVVRGIRFDGPVLVGGDATVLMSDCRFASLVTVDNGGRLACSGCRFDGNSAIDNSAGPAANTCSVGGVHTSAVAHINVGTIIEV